MTLTNLRAKTRFLLGELTSDNYSDTNLDRAINDALHEAEAVAILASGSWEVNGEIATADTRASIKEYTFPTNLVKLIKIELNTLGGTTTWDLAQIYDDRGNVQSNNITDTTGQTAITLFDNSFFFEDPPKDVVVGGLKVWYSKEATELSASDEPKMPEHLHMYLVYSACIDYCRRINDVNGINQYTQYLLKKEDEIKTYYTNRLSVGNPRITTRKENYE